MFVKIYYRILIIKWCGNNKYSRNLYSSNLLERDEIFSILN